MQSRVFVAVAVVILSACASETTATTTLAETTTTTSIPTTTTPPPQPTTTVPAATTTTDQIIDVEVRNGEVSGPDRFRFDRGDMVQITILSDTAYEVHVHGYELIYDLVAEEPHTIEFMADVPGIFEVETHPGHILLFEIEVGA